MANFSHRQVEASPPGQTAILVDEGMKPLLEQFWARGAQTQFSCEGRDKTSALPILEERAYVLLWATDEAESLIEELMVRTDFSQALRVRWRRWDRFLLPERKLSRVGYSIELDTHFAVAPRYCLRFPGRDIPLLASYLRSSVVHRPRSFPAPTHSGWTAVEQEKRLNEKKEV